MSLKTCADCGNSFALGSFSKRQWLKPDGSGRCKQCVPGHVEKCREDNHKEQLANPRRNQRRSGAWDSDVSWCPYDGPDDPDRYCGGGEWDEGSGFFC